MTATATELLERAAAWIEKGWVRGIMWSTGPSAFDPAFASADQIRDEERKKRVTHVCSVGALRLAFAELVELNVESYDTWAQFEHAVTHHPLYQEGMALLGRGFFEAGTVDDLSDPQELLRDSTQVVQTSVITVNDDDSTSEAEIKAGFAKAVELSRA